MPVKAAVSTEVFEGAGPVPFQGETGHTLSLAFATSTGEVSAVRSESKKALIGEICRV